MNIEKHIRQPLCNATYDELALIYIISIEGKNYFKKIENLQKETTTKSDTLMIDSENSVFNDFQYLLIDEVSGKKYTKTDLENIIPSKLELAIIEGLSIIDKVTGFKTNYSKQLSFCINKLISSKKDGLFSKIKNLTDNKDEKVKKKQKKIWIDKQYLEYRNIENDKIKYSDKILKYEELLISFLFGASIIDLSESQKKEFEREIREILKKYKTVFNIPESIKYDEILNEIMTGSIAAVRKLVGVRFFHSLVMAIASSLSRIITGVGISFTANILMQRVGTMLLGPIGWIITGALLLWDIPSIINRRRLDKYIPAIIHVYYLRHKDDFINLTNLP